MTRRIRQPHDFRGWVTLALVVSLPTCLVAAPAEETKDNKATLEYRRVFVPEETIGELADGYMPLKREDFDRLLTQLGSQARTSEVPSARIKQAEYYATFNGRELVTGQAHLEVVHTSSTTSLLSLHPCQLAIGPAEWKGEEDVLPAKVGIDREGSLVALVDRSAQLSFPWSLRGQSNDSQQISFDLQLAPALRNRLILDLPDDMTVTVDRGLVSQRPDAVTKSVVLSELPESSSRWIIQLGGATRCRLTISPRQAADQPQSLIVAEQQSTFRLADDGFELQAVFRFDIRHEPLRQLAFDLDPELQVVSVQVSGDQVPWTVAAGPTDARRQLQVSLEQPLSGLGGEVQILTVGPIHTASKWTLPTVTALDCFWRQGSLGLVTPESLVLEHLKPVDAVETDVTMGNREPNARREFLLFSPAGSLEVELARRRPKILADMGVTVNVEPGTLTAECVIDFRCQVGRRFVLEADVPNAWTIDGIEAEPADAIEGFQFAGYRAGQKRLQIRLSRPLDKERPLRLKVRAHRTPALVLRSDHFRPLRLLDVETTSHHVALAPDSRFRLDLNGDADLVRLDPERMPNVSQSRLQPRDGGLVFVDDEHAESLVITITRENPAFSTAIRMVATVDEEVLTEFYRIRCTPESTSVQQLLIHLSETRSSDIEWQMAGDTTRFLSIRRLTPEQQQMARLGKAGETWELLLRNAESESFEILGKRRKPMESSQSIALAALPAANTQEGWLTVHAAHDESLSIRTRQVKTIPAEPSPADQYSTTRGHFRYDPSRNAQVTVQRIDRPSQPDTLWAWRCEMTTQLALSGDAIHHVRYALENWGASNFQLRLPVGSSLRSVEVDGRPVDVQPFGTDTERLYTIPLPDKVRFPSARITFTDTRESLGLFQRVTARFPEPSISVLDQAWIVFMPPGYEPAAGNRLVWPAAAREVNWQRRLFGAIAAPPGRQPFRLFSAADWRSLLGKVQPSGGQNAAAKKFLHDLGSRFQSYSQDSDRGQLSWRRLFQDYQDWQADRPATGSAPAIWVEAQQLVDAGFSLDDPVPTPAGKSPSAVAGSLFARANLVLIADRQRLLITSPFGLSGRLDSVQSMTDRVVATVRRGSLLSREMQAYSTQPLSRPVSLDNWLDSMTTRRTPWPAHLIAAESGLPNCPWPACEVRVTSGQPSQVILQRSAVLWAIGWATLLISTGLMAWAAYYRPRWMAVATIGTATLALIVPGVLVPIASNLFLGTLLGMILIVTWSLAPSRRAAGHALEAGDRFRRSAAVSLRVLVLVSCLTGGWRTMLAAEPASRSTPPDSQHQIHSVLVPVDDEYNPTGEYDYLPLDFYDTLHQRAKQASVGGRGWLLRSANYRGRLNWRLSQSELELVNMTALFQLESFRPLQQVRIPWHNDPQEVEILEARLSGQPLELQWNADKTAFALTLQSAGVAQLELVLRPVTRRKETQQEIDFQIPRIHQSRLEITLPADVGDLELPTAVGGTTIDPETGVLSAKLGPVSQLTVRWPAADGDSLSPNRPQVEQLLWLRVQQQHQLHPVVVEATLRVQAIARDMTELRIATDPRLHLLPLSSEATGKFRQPVIEGGETQKILLPFRQPMEGEFRLKLQFALDRSASVGHIQFPRIDVMDCRVIRRWVALTVASGLEFQAARTDSLASIGTAEFLAAWGPTEIVPDLTYRATEPTPIWNIQVRTREPVTTAQQRIDLTMGRRMLNWVLEAQLTTTEGALFQHRLVVPAHSEITSAAVIFEDMDIVAHAHQTQDGLVTLFFGRGVQGEYRLELRGQQRLEQDDVSFALPRISLLDVAVDRHQLNLYRKSNALVSIASESKVTTLDHREIGRFRESFGRLIASYELAEQGVTRELDAMISIRPNRPPIDARLVTTMARNDNVWQATIDLELQLSSDDEGLLDEFRLRISPELAEPLTVEPETNHLVRPIPGQRDRMLVLRPHRPVSDRISVRISGKLEIGQNDRVHTPTIVALDATSVEQYLVLPTQLDQQRIDWVTSGLQPVPLQNVLDTPDVTPRTETAFRVWSRPRATIATVQQVAGSRQIGLADIKLAVRAQQRQISGTATFQLEPAGMSHCTLSVPEHCQLMRVTIEGTPVTPMPMTEQSWRLRLGPDHVPQEVSVVFQMKSLPPSTNEFMQLSVPWITGFEVAKTLWSVQGPPGVRLNKSTFLEHQVSLLTQDKLRLQSITQLIESGSEVVVENPPAEIMNWYVPWATRWVETWLRIQNIYTQSEGPSAEANLDWMSQQYARQTAIAESLGMTEVLEQIHADSSNASTVDAAWPLLEPLPLASKRSAFSGPMSSVTLDWQPIQRSTTSWFRWILAGTLVAGLVFFSRWDRSPLRLARFDEWPYFLAVCVGLVWWLWCTPSVLGWAVIAVAVWAAVRPPAPCRPLDRSHGHDRAGHSG